MVVVVSLIRTKDEEALGVLFAVHELSECPLTWAVVVSVMALDGEPQLILGTLVSAALVDRASLAGGEVSIEKETLYTIDDMSATVSIAGHYHTVQASFVLFQLLSVSYRASPQKEYPPAET